MDLESQRTADDISTFFGLADPTIVPIFRIEKRKPIYVEINGNNFYMGVVTQEKVKS